MITPNVEIQSILNLRNEIANGITAHDALMEIKIDKSTESDNVLKIRWKFQAPISQDQYIIHQTLTQFRVRDMTLDILEPRDPRMITIAELGVVALAHARVMFMQANKDVKEIPTYIDRNALVASLFAQIRQQLN